MDLNEIKGIIKADGGKFIIVENNKPSLVVISFDEYKKHLQIETDKPPTLFEHAEQNDREVLSCEPLPEENLADEKDDKKNNDELTIDDLPL
jgi:PHD/YefM family antitoxin component YafN of YafNO toxin-antitoxin module